MVPTAGSYFGPGEESLACLAPESWAELWKLHRRKHCSSGWSVFSPLQGFGDGVAPLTPVTPLPEHHLLCEPFSKAGDLAEP